MVSEDNPPEDQEPFPEYYHVTDVLDLHGLAPAQIPEVVEEFLLNARKLGLQRLQIIHGKGKSKLKYLVHQELVKHPDVLAFGDARPQDGGWGRTVILLKAR